MFAILAVSHKLIGWQLIKKKSENKSYKFAADVH